MVERMPEIWRRWKREFIQHDCAQLESVAALSVGERLVVWIVVGVCRHNPALYGVGSLSWKQRDQSDLITRLIQWGILEHFVG